MKTGIESLDTGAPDITYEGNEGPKSPQQMQQMASMEAGQEGTLEDIFNELIEMGMSPEDAAIKAREIYNDMGSKGQGGIGNMAMKSGLIDDYRNYKMQQLEIDPSKLMSPRDWYQSEYGAARAGVADGGIMRTGFQGGGADMGREDKAQERADRGYGDTSGVDRSRTSPRQDYNTAIATKKNPLGLDMSKGAPDLTSKEKEFVKDNASFLEKTKNKFIQGGLNRNKVEAIRQMGLMRSGLSGFYGKLFSGMTGKVPENLEDLTEDELTALAFEVQKFKDAGGPINQATYNPNLNPTNKTGGLNLLSRVFEGQDLLDNDLMTQKNYDTLFPGPTASTGGDGPPIILPYSTTTGGSADTKNVDAFSVDPIRFASNVPSEHDFSGKYFYGADGGRTNYAGGGITDLRQAYGFGKLVKKFTKGIKKVAKSPLGKAALMFGLGSIPFGAKGSLISRMGGLGGGSGGEGFWSGMLGSISDKPFPWIAGASALGGLYTAMNPEDEEDGYDYAEKDKWLKYHAGVGDKKNWQPIRFAADGGRIGLKEGLTPRQAALSAMYGENEDEDNMYKFAYGGSTGLPPVTIAPEGFNSQSFPDDETTGIAQATPQNPMPMAMAPQMDPRRMAQMDPRRMAQQGMPRRMAAEGGLMDMGGMEKDYRAEGGFVPLGGEERADDVPARLSKNEFVFTADAVRSAGSGDIDKGAEVMENLMNNLEQGGQVSQGSQGLEGAREMFQTQQRLGEVL